MSGLDALPAVPASALPTAVREGSPADQKAYRAALGFERLLLQSFVENMTKSGGLDDSPYAGQIQDGMSDALQAGGGIGLGEQLYHSLRPSNVVQRTSASEVRPDETRRTEPAPAPEAPA